MKGKSVWPSSDLTAYLGEKNTSAHLYSWIFTYLNQVADMLRATAEQQLAFANLQPTNLLFNHNTVNSSMTMTENGLE